MTFQEEPIYELMKDLLKRVILNVSNNLKEEYIFILRKKLMDVLDYPDGRVKNEINGVKSKLFSGFNINLVKFIKNLNKLNLINCKILNKSFISLNNNIIINKNFYIKYFIINDLYSNKVS